MASTWYCTIDGTEYGPMSGADLKRMAEQGKLRITDQIKNTPTGKWLAASSVKGLVFKKAPEPSPAITERPIPRLQGETCPSCRTNLQPAAVVCIRCGFDLRTGKKLTGSMPDKNQRASSSAAGQSWMPLGWLLGLSTIAGLFFGAVGFGLGSVGFQRETQRITQFSKFGERTGETFNGTLRFYGITLLKSDDMLSFDTSSNLIAVLIAAATTGVSALCGGGCIFVAIRRLTRRRQKIKGDAAY
jgi:uncharacterized protein DUF4339